MKLSSQVQNLSAINLRRLFDKPASWSVQSLLQATDASSLPEPSITKPQLHHLLRLSALQLPASKIQEAKMMKDLEAQLRFVQAVQKVDTEGVEPLQSIRDETKKGERENMVTVKSLKAEFEKEVVVGKRGRIIKRKHLPPIDEERLENWDPLAQAPRRLEKYFMVETEKD